MTNIIIQSYMSKDTLNIKEDILPAECLAKIKGMKETSVEKNIREAKEYEEKLKEYERNLVRDINIGLIQNGSYDKTIYSDNANYSRSDLINICKKVEKKYEDKGYYVSTIHYADSNRSKVYHLYIKI